MRDHPIQPVTEPYQYRAIGIVKGIYIPEDPEKLTRGHLKDLDGEEIEAVVLGRVLALMKRYLSLDAPHLWVVYPRCREINHLHLQIAGIWEPSTLMRCTNENRNNDNALKEISDDLVEGDNYFSIRGQLIYTRPETKDLVIKIRQKRRSDKKQAPFKIQLKGEIPIQNLREFVDLKVRRKLQNLELEEYEVIGNIPSQSIDKIKNSRSSSRKLEDKGTEIKNK